MTHTKDTERAALLPCPFCGEPAEIIRHGAVSHVRCRQWACGCHGSSTFEYSPEKAIISWNRRVPAAPVQIDPALVQAIQRAGLQVLKTATGYEVCKLGPAVAQSSVSNGENAAPANMGNSQVDLPAPDAWMNGTDAHYVGTSADWQVSGDKRDADDIGLYTADTVRALLTSAQQDAARYRWVREQAEFFPLVMDGTGLLCAEIAEAEAEIDAAIAAAPKEPAP